MPEEIVTPLLAGSLRYITTFATDILAARAALDRLEARRARLPAAERGLPDAERRLRQRARSEEHTSELQSLMRTSYAVFCLKNKKQTPNKRRRHKRYRTIPCALQHN